MVNQQIFALVLIIFAGYLAKKIKIADDSWVSILNNFAFYIALPSLVFFNLITSDLKSLFQSNFFVLNFFSIIIFIFFAYFLCSLMKLEKEERAIFTIACVFGNVAYLGIPIGQIVGGKEGEIVATLISVLYLLLVLTFGIFLLEYTSSQEKRIKILFMNILKLPLFWSILLGIFFSFLKIPLPEFLVSSIKMLSQTASPVALFAMGIFICECFLREKILLTFLLTFLKMIVFPAFVFLVFHFCYNNIKDLAFTISILQASMPLAVTNFVLAKKYNFSPNLISNAIFLSTLFAVGEIFLLVNFLT